MCTRPIIIKNKKYQENKKNEGIIPKCEDERLKTLKVACGRCPECRKQAAREWQMRLTEEYLNLGYGQFVTLTISDKEGEKLSRELNTNDSETIAKAAVKKFRERWRKKYKKSPRHFLITELGHSKKYLKGGITAKGTQRLHLHGIIFEPIEKFGKVENYRKENKKAGRISEELTKLWKYGHTLLGYSDLNEKTINYVTKYITKIDLEHRGYYGKKLVSPGIGREYVNRPTIKKAHEYKDENTNEQYAGRGSIKGSIPMYWRQKIWSEKQREKLTIIKLNRKTVFVCGIEIEATNHKAIDDILKTRRAEERRLGLIKPKKKMYEWRNGTNKDIPYIDKEAITKLKNIRDKAYVYATHST